MRFQLIGSTMLLFSISMLGASPFTGGFENVNAAASGLYQGAPSGTVNTPNEVQVNPGNWVNQPQDTTRHKKPNGSPSTTPGTTPSTPGVTPGVTPGTPTNPGLSPNPPGQPGNPGSVPNTPGQPTNPGTPTNPGGTPTPTTPNSPGTSPGSTPPRNH